MSKAITAISKAEQALAQANDIVEILDLRTQAKAIEVVAIAQGYAEIAQKAKIFQIKAERKAGWWLSENIQWGGDASSHRVTLSDLDISKHESSRWQLMSKVPEEKFVLWVDDRLASDQEITAGGLRMYARNVIGKPHKNSYVGRISLVPPRCALEGYIVKCSGDPSHEHIISKSKTIKNKAAREYLDQDKNIAITCLLAHNVNKLSDNPTARKIMIIQKVYEHGFTEMKEFFDNVPWKVAQYEFTIEAMLDA